MGFPLSQMNVMNWNKSYTDLSCLSNSATFRYHNGMNPVRDRLLQTTVKQLFFIANTFSLFLNTGFHNII